MVVVVIDLDLFCIPFANVFKPEIRTWFLILVTVMVASCC